MLKGVLKAVLRVLAGTIFVLALAATVGIPSSKRGPAAAEPGGEPRGLDLQGLAQDYLAPAEVPRWSPRAIVVIGRAALRLVPDRPALGVRPATIGFLYGLLDYFTSLSGRLSCSAMMEPRIRSKLRSGAEVSANACCRRGPVGVG